MEILNIPVPTPHPLNDFYWKPAHVCILQDRFATDRYLPPVDESQDWFLVSGEEENGYTIMEFTRKLTTCDDKDLTIKVYTGIEAARMIAILLIDRYFPPDIHVYIQGDWCMDRQYCPLREYYIIWGYTDTLIKYLQGSHPRTPSHDFDIRHNLSVWSLPIFF